MAGVTNVNMHIVFSIVQRISSGLWHCAKASITMKRKFQFHVFQAYIPTAMLVTISWFSFWLDVKAAPARVGLTITTLLTLLTISNGNRQDLPLVRFSKCENRGSVS